MCSSDLLIPLLAERKVEMGVIMAIIALIGPMQVVGRVLLLAGQRHVTTAQLGAGIYFAFPISMGMLAMGISDVYGLILFAVLRYRRKPTDTELPPQIHGNNTIEVIWTAVPTLVVAVLFFLSWQVLNTDRKSTRLNSSHT